MKYFYYFTREGNMEIIENPHPKIKERLPDMAFSIGLIKAKSKVEADREARKILGYRLKNAGFLKK